MIDFAGIVHSSTIDYPGKMCAVVYLSGCDFRCPFCFTENNYLLTDRGKMKIKDIVENKINCKVYDSLGDFSTIKKYYKRVAKEILQIRTFYNTEIIECTPNHKFLVYSSKLDKIVEKEANNLDRKYDYLTITIPQRQINAYKIDVRPAILDLYKELNYRLRFNDKDIINKVIELRNKGYSWRKIYKETGLNDNIRRIIEKKDYLDSKILPAIKEKNGKIAVKGSEFYLNKFIKITPEFMRLIGYYLSEGHTTKDKNRKNSYCIGFTFNQKEKKYIKDTKKIFFNIFNIKLRESKIDENNTVQLCCDRGIIGILFKYYFGSNCCDKKLPIDFIYLDKKLQIELIKGLFRGDGISSEKYIKKYQKQRIQISSGSLYYQISLILYRLGIKHSRFRNEILITDKKIFGILGQNHLITKKIINFDECYGFLDKDRVYLKIRDIKKEKKNTNIYNLEMNNKSHTYNVSLINVSNCHNKDLVTGDVSKKVNVEEIVQLLANNFLIEAVCLTGGEPLMQEDIIKLIAVLRKNTPLAIKLDTNGSFPEKLEKILPALSFISLDIKAPFEKYDKAIGVNSSYIITNLSKTLEIIRKCKFPKEARTTIVPGLNDSEEDIANIAKIVNEYKFDLYTLQQFKPKNTLDPNYMNIPSPSLEQMRILGKLAKSLLPQTKVRIVTLEKGFESII